MNKKKQIRLPISKFIDSRFREYALYVLSSRGIPNFYDGLTPVQRYILMNCPQTFTKTLSVVGKAIEANYHHGNCLDYFTKINLADGSQITLGEWADKYPDAELLVKSIDENTLEEVIGIAHSPRVGQKTNEYYEIEMENGEIFRATENHPFFVNNEWIEAKVLKEDTEILSLLKDKTLKIKSIKKIISDKPINFYDLTVEKYHNFSIGDSKIISHNSSLEKAIAKLARPFGMSSQIIEGYGFFGSEVCPEPAAARYTSVKLSKESSDLIKKYKHLNTKEPDGPYNPFWMELPLGLLTTVVGIAVGYKSTVLPRKASDIVAFFEGKIKHVPPYFSNFNGHISAYKGLEKAWLLSSKITIKDKRIEVREFPPILNYSSVIKKLDYLFNHFEGKIKILNNSNTKVNIDILYTGTNSKEWEEIQAYVNRVFAIIVTENIVFVKDEQVLVYDTIEQYLEDYKWQLKRLAWKNTEWERDWTNSELIFNRAKEELINFIIQKKRAVTEIDEFLEPYTSDIRSRLEGLTSKKFTKDELESTKAKIKDLEKELKSKEKELLKNKKEFDSMIDPTLKRGLTSKRTSVDLFNDEDIREDMGITIWAGEDPFDANDNLMEEDE